MNKILVVFGTRPEAIKLIPVIRELQNQGVRYEVLNTNQHAEILDSLLSVEGIIPDYKLSICGQYDNLIETKAAMLKQLNIALGKNTYTSIIVQGDTLSALVGAEYGFLRQIPVYHVEAGMRTYNPSNPYPEECFRRMISVMATLHFCPSNEEKDNLIAEGVSSNNIYVVGNTFVDYRKRSNKRVVENKKQILITLHRRENIPHLDTLFMQIAEIAKATTDYKWLFPVHPNPIIERLAKKHLEGISNIVLSSPLSSDAFYQELLASELIVSDSGGVQEECILNAKKMLVVREVSERKTDFDFMEIVSPTENLKEHFYSLLNKESTTRGADCYGTGNAAEQIVQIIVREGVK